MQSVYHMYHTDSLLKSSELKVQGAKSSGPSQTPVLTHTQSGHTDIPCRGACISEENQSNGKILPLTM